MKKGFISSLLTFLLILTIIPSFNIYADEVTDLEPVVNTNLEPVVKSMETVNVEFIEPVNKVMEGLSTRAYPLRGNSVEIRSFDDLKPHLEYKAVQKSKDSKDLIERLVLKGGNYEIVASFEIDLSDSFFRGKEKAIRYGLISTTEEILIRGNGNTISFRQDEAVALFGIVNSPAYTIENLKIEYPGNVAGFAFAQVLQSERTDTGLATANGIVKDIEVRVGGNVTPLIAIGYEKDSVNFVGTYSGVISSGFSWYIENSNVENININVVGNIGNTQRPMEEKDMVAAYGFTHHFENVFYSDIYNSQTWNELHYNGNPGVLKDAGHIIGLNINVGGNIQAYGNNAGYSAGVGQDMSNAWMENIHLKIKGDIITDLEGKSTPMEQSYCAPYAFGFSDELMNLTDSTLEVNNIIFNSADLPQSSNLVILGAMANKNSKGNYINIKNNIVNVKDKIEGKSNQTILASVGFGTQMV